MNTSAFAELETYIGESVVKSTPVANGSSSSCSVIHTDSGHRYFVKSGIQPGNLRMEAQGLRLLRAADGVRVPEVIHCSDTHLVMEYLELSSPGTNFQTELGHQLAETHRTQHTHYGFPEDHCIGDTPQKNQPWVPVTPDAWSTFWWEYRLHPMLQRISDPDILKPAARLENRIQSILSGTDEPPTLVHGDLWNGNMSADESGSPVMFDPAAYYGHREAELGMTRMFGGFSADFYDAYHESFPLLDDWEHRSDLYMLYHVLNHVVLFGQSYSGHAIRILNAYV